MYNGMHVRLHLSSRPSTQYLARLQARKQESNSSQAMKLQKQNLHVSTNEKYRRSEASIQSAAVQRCAAPQHKLFSKLVPPGI